jgi:hypothetical protein
MIQETIEQLIAQSPGYEAGELTREQQTEESENTLRRLGIEPDEVRESLPRIVQAAVVSVVAGNISPEQAIANAYSTGIMVGALEVHNQAD